jgi:hypothetical protein
VKATSTDLHRTSDRVRLPLDPTHENAVRIDEAITVGSVKQPVSST